MIKKSVLRVSWAFTETYLKGKYHVLPKEWFVSLLGSETKLLLLWKTILTPFQNWHKFDQISIHIIKKKQQIFPIYGYYRDREIISWYAKFDLLNTIIIQRRMNDYMLIWGEQDIFITMEKVNLHTHTHTHSRARTHTHTHTHIYIYIYISNDSDRRRGRTEGSFFNSYYTNVLGILLLLSRDCSTLPLIRIF